MVIGAALSDKAPQGFIRTALGVVLIGSGIVTIQKGDPTVWPIAAAVAGARARRGPLRSALAATAAASGERKAGELSRAETCRTSRTIAPATD